MVSRLSIGFYLRAIYYLYAIEFLSLYFVVRSTRALRALTPSDLIASFNTHLDTQPRLQLSQCRTKRILIPDHFPMDGFLSTLQSKRHS